MEVSLSSLPNLIWVFLVPIFLYIGVRVVMFFMVWRKKAASLTKPWNDYCLHQSSVVIDEDTGDITFSHVRDFTWHKDKEKESKWLEDITVNVNEIKDVWFIVDHFFWMKGVAHLMLSFEFNDGRCFSFSFEARRTVDDTYHPWHGMWRAYEMYLVMGTEKDLVGIRAFKRGNQVHRYRTVTSKRREKAFLLSFAREMQSLHEKPVFYHSLTNSCSTILRKLINEVSPIKIPMIWRVILPGHSARMGYRLGLLERWGDYEETRDRARIDLHLQKWDGKEDFSGYLTDKLPKKAR